MNNHPRKTHFQHKRAVKHHQLALKYFDENNFGLALGNFLLVAKLCPELISELQETVTSCLERAASWLENAGRHEELLRIYESALDVFPDCGGIINALGEYLFRHGHVLQSAAHFLRATRANRRLVLARDNLDRANARLVDRWHFTMLNDAGRNAAYGRAVRGAAGRLAEQDLVLDVGAGTGLLSMMAAQAGASAVYACESSDAMCQVAAAVLADNGMQQRVHVINKWSHQLTVGADLPRRAALLVTETFDAGLLGEHVLSTLDHAWRHLLLPPAEGGRVVPAAAAVWAAAVESRELRTQLMGQLPSGGRLRRRLCEPYWSERLAHVPGGYRLISEPVQVYTVDFNEPASVARGLAGLQARHVTRCTAAGRLDALVTWFELQLGGREVVNSEPGGDSCWEQAVYAVPAGHTVQPGQTLTLETVCRGHLQLRLIHTQPQQAADADQDADAGIIAFVNDGRQVAALEAALRRWRAGRPVEPPPRVLNLCPVPVDGLQCSPAGAGLGHWDAVLCAPVLPSGRLDPAVMGAVQSVSLASGGLLAPCRLLLLAVAVSSRLVLHMSSVLRENTDGFDCDAINMFRVHQLQDFPYANRDVSTDMSDVKCISCLDMATGGLQTSEFSIPVTSAGVLHGLVYWFRPTDGSDGGLGRPQYGRQMVAVLSSPRTVRPGDHVAGSVHPTADGVYVTIDD